MNEIYNLESDSSLLDELWNCIRNRDVEQKFLYQWNWASLYYLQKHSNKMYNGLTLEKEDFLSFFKKNIENLDKKLDIISFEIVYSICMIVIYWDDPTMKLNFKL